MFFWGGWGFRVEKTPLEMLFRDGCLVQGGWGQGEASGRGPTSSSEWGLMKTNDLTGSKG